VARERWRPGRACILLAPALRKIATTIGGIEKNLPPRRLTAPPQEQAAGAIRLPLANGGQRRDYSFWNESLQPGLEVFSAPPAT